MTCMYATCWLAIIKLLIYNEELNKIYRFISHTLGLVRSSGSFQLENTASDDSSCSILMELQQIDRASNLF